MTSPPRRMTRARAKVEGYEPDWRINPQWKTPKKAKPKSTRFAEPDKGTETLKRSIIAGGAERVPSPTKIRIPAKLSIQQLQQPAEASVTPAKLGSETANNSKDPEGLRKSVLGSAVRVRSIQVRNSTSDKENSPVAAFPAWGASKKPAAPNTPSVASRPRPLEASPTVFNTHQHVASVKVLSTPIRVLNPHTPGRLLGSARRIPIKVDKTKPKAFTLHTIADHQESIVPPDFAQAGNLWPSSPSRSTTSATVKPASPLKSQHRHELEFIDPIPNKPASKPQLSCMNASLVATIPEQSPDSTHWTPLKPIPPLQRKSSAVTKLQQSRPSKLQQERPLSLQITKRDFYVDESISIPLKADSGSAKRSTTQVPKFPIRRRSISQSASSNEESLPNSNIGINDIHFDGTKESRTADRADKGINRTNAAAQMPFPRKLEFRTMNTVALQTTRGTPIGLKGSSSMLTVHTASVEAAASNSTTPHGTPQPLSPKVFDFSETENSPIYIFTPRKGKSFPDCQTNTEKRTRIHKPALAEVQAAQRTKNISPSSAIVPSIQTSTSHDNRHQRTTLLYKGAIAQDHQQDIIVPIKDPCPLNVVAEDTSRTPINSNKSTRIHKTHNGPLQGVIAYVDVRTADGDDAGAPFAEALRNMGAKVVRQWTWNGEEVDRISVTHVIFKQGGPRTLSKVKLAKGAIKCVGLGWISRYMN